MSDEPLSQASTRCTYALRKGCRSVSLLIRNEERLRTTAIAFRRIFPISPAASAGRPVPETTKAKGALSLTSLGAAGTVTGSKHLIEHDRGKLLVDCRLFQGTTDLRELNWSPLLSSAGPAIPQMGQSFNLASEKEVQSA